MRFTQHNTVRGEGNRFYTLLPRDEVTGVVYLFQCICTREYKFGSSYNPLMRFSQLRSLSGMKGQRNVVYLWSTITNSAGRLERYWHRQWAKYRTGDGRLEWVHLPDSEVARFCSVSLVNYKDLPPVTDELKDALSPLPEHHRFRLPWSPRKRA